MDYYFDVISQLKCSNRGGYKAPHKAIYLLAILDMIDFEWISDRKFHVTLRSQFQCLAFYAL